MSEPFVTGCENVDLHGEPWQITTEVSLYLRNLDGALALFWDDACTLPFEPPEVEIFPSVRTGLYFFVSSQSNQETKFEDGLDGRREPIDWKGHRCPSTVTYGKIRVDRKAFSIMDFWKAPNTATRDFDLNVELPNGQHVSVGALARVDPRIIEAGEEPPV